MNNTINLKLTNMHLLIIFIIILFITLTYVNFIYYIYKDNNQYKYSDNLLNKMSKNILNITKDKEDKENNKISEIPRLLDNNYDIENSIEKHKFLNKRDYNVVNDKLVPPDRRLPEYMYPYNYIKNMINVPTRGYPENYHLYGIVHRDTFETVYRLYGRQTYPGSNQYEYYIQGSINDNTTKIPVENNNGTQIKIGKEIDDGQILVIPGTNLSRGNFIVKLYKHDIPRYNPYIDMN